MAERLPTLVAELDALVLSIAHQVARLSPAVLLHRAWWEFVAINLGIGGKEALDSDQVDALRMVDYVQSLIASVKPDTYAEDVSEDDWKKLKVDVADLFHRLTIEYQTCLTVKPKLCTDRC